MKRREAQDAAENKSTSQVMKFSTNTARFDRLEVGDTGLIGPVLFFQLGLPHLHFFEIKIKCLINLDGKIVMRFEIINPPQEFNVY